MMNSMGGDDLPDLDGAEDEVCFFLIHRVLFLCGSYLYYRDGFFSVWRNYNQVKFIR